MIKTLSAIGYGIVGFAIVVVIGIVVIGELGESVANCATGFELNGTTGNCQNATNFSDTATPTGTGYTTSTGIITYLGTSGLAGWIPAVIAVAIGGLFMVYFGSRKKGY